MLTVRSDANVRQSEGLPFSQQAMTSLHAALVDLDVAELESLREELKKALILEKKRDVVER